MSKKKTKGPVAENDTSTGREIDCKRFYFPAKLTATCPKCGKRRTRHFEDDYLSYPSLNEPFETYVVCTPCDYTEIPVTITLRVEIEVEQA